MQALVLKFAEIYLTKSLEAMALLQTAQAEKRDITPAEFEKLQQSDDLARAELEAEINRQRSG